MKPHTYSHGPIIRKVDHPLEMWDDGISVIKGHQFVLGKGFLFYSRTHPEVSGNSEYYDIGVRQFLGNNGFEFWKHYTIEPGPNSIGGDPQICRAVLFHGSAITMAKMLDYIN